MAQTALKTKYVEFTDAEDMVEYFSRGQCHALALAFHKITGWPLAGSAYMECGDPDHIIVINDDGHSVDIFGINEKGLHPDDVPYDWTTIPESRIIGLVKSERYGPAEMQTAEHYAPLLLAAFSDGYEFEEAIERVLEGHYS